jgi:hypothetical protein
MHLQTAATEGEEETIMCKSSDVGARGLAQLLTNASKLSNFLCIP